jgi:hypothetical protein
MIKIFLLEKDCRHPTTSSGEWRLQLTKKEKESDAGARDTHRGFGAAAHVVEVKHELDGAVLHAIDNAARVACKENIAGPGLHSGDVLVGTVDKVVLAAGTRALGPLP